MSYRGSVGRDGGKILDGGSKGPLREAVQKGSHSKLVVTPEPSFQCGSPSGKTREDSLLGLRGGVT